MLHNSSRMPPVKPYSNEADLLDKIGKRVADGKMRSGRLPRVIIIGALGRCGRGTVDLLEKIDIPPENIIKWDLAETGAKSGPYLEIVESDIFINCIYLTDKIPPFVDTDVLQKPERKLSVICDVSCDTTNPNSEYLLTTDLYDFR